jgi:excinuclease UvrABC ATPase subunit
MTMTGRNKVILMSTTITVEQRLLDKISKLTSEKIIEVEDFIDFLYQRQNVSDYNLVMAATKISEASFSKVWDNPEDAEYDNL